jgi:hypothetical protein
MFGEEIVCEGSPKADAAKAYDYTVVSGNENTVVLRIDAKWFKTFPKRVRERIASDFALKKEQRQNILFDAMDKLRSEKLEKSRFIEQLSNIHSVNYAKLVNPNQMGKITHYLENDEKEKKAAWEKAKKAKRQSENLLKPYFYRNIINDEDDTKEGFPDIQVKFERKKFYPFESRRIGISTKPKQEKKAAPSKQEKLSEYAKKIRIMNKYMGVTNKYNKIGTSPPNEYKMIMNTDDVAHQAQLEKLYPEENYERELKDNLATPKAGTDQFKFKLAYATKIGLEPTKLPEYDFYSSAIKEVKGKVQSRKKAVISTLHQNEI